MAIDLLNNEKIDLAVLDIMMPRANGVQVLEYIRKKSTIPVIFLSTKKMFEPFVLGDNARKTSGGSGLGLAIVKVIIEKHDGTIIYVDTNIGTRIEIRM